jgi:hypothetical protein
MRRGHGRRYGHGVVLWHCAFADCRLMVDVTPDVDGRLVETGDAGSRFPYNSDVATPMRPV